MTAAPGRESSVDGRDRRADARVVGDLAVVERDVEVDADEDPLARDVDVADGQLVHAVMRCRRRTRRGAPATNAMRSATRQL